MPEAEKVFTYDVVEPSGSDAAGDIERVTTSFNETTNELTFQLVISGDEADGFTLAINDGPNPKGNVDELALIYFDNSGDQPILTAYNYNGQNDFSSFEDTPLASSLNPNSPFSNMEVSTDAYGNTVFSFNLDATDINAYSQDEAWTGVAFGEHVGVWLHPMSGIESSYGDDGFLDSWDIDEQSWLDVANRDTVCEHIEPEPENQNPQAYDDSNVTTKANAVSGNVLFNDFDPDGDTLSAALANPPQNGSVTLNPDGEYVYTPYDGFSGQDTFTYEVTCLLYTSPSPRDS